MPSVTCLKVSISDIEKVRSHVTVRSPRQGLVGVPEEDFFDMSVEELASKLEFGVQPSFEQAAAEVGEVMEVD